MIANSTTKQPRSTSWRDLQITGAVAALLDVLIFRRNFSAEMMVSNGFGLFDVPKVPPVTAVDWFTLLQNNWFVGLVLFHLFDLVDYLLVGLIFLALYVTLRQTNKSMMLLAIVLTFFSILLYLATNQAFSMLTLSHRYAAAETDAQKMMFLAAGEALLAIENPGVLYQGFGYYLSWFSILVAGLLISIVMLQSQIFPKVTAFTGIVANVLALGFFITLAFAPGILWLPPTLSAPLRMIWYILIAVKLFQLSRKTSKEYAPS